MIDKRVIERQIRKGKLDGAAYKRTLESLPDVSDRVARDADIEPSRPAISSVASVSVSVSASSSGHAQAGAEAEPEMDDDLDDEDDEDDVDDEDEAEDAENAEDVPAST